MTLNPKVISFFKNHNMYNKEMFKYIEKNSTEINYKDKEQRDFIGCFYTYDKRNKLKTIHLNIPYVYDDETILINIHEITHAIILYKNLGKKFNPDITEETLPLMLEKLYVLENPSKELEEHLKKLDEIIYRENEPQYVFGLTVRDELISKYNNHPKKTLKRIKKIAKLVNN